MLDLYPGFITILGVVFEWVTQVEQNFGQSCYFDFDFDQFSHFRHFEPEFGFGSETSSVVRFFHQTYDDLHSHFNRLPG